ncbi:hypothetical protein PV327_010950 [Microctonus hyperodae]|uniref:Uncharacterized protein n=1 Tax=Microctonus hyperodae TaxID=165561 RepID=A0AA39KUK2_MICHY|nr:hypothetical protein PV327_010950 [Microctonus hyperodae]
MGRFQDPISFEQGENEYGSHHQLNPSGDRSNVNRSRTPQVTFADDYKEFLEQFRTRFLSVDSQAKLLAEIKARTQRTGESLAAYITKMQYNSPPPPEKSILPDLAWSQNNSRKAWGILAAEEKNEVNATDVTPGKIVPTPSKNKVKKSKQSKTFATQNDPIPITTTPPENMAACYSCGQEAEIVGNVVVLNIHTESITCQKDGGIVTCAGGKTWT